MAYRKIENPQGAKYCPTCDTQKPVGEFHRNRTRRFGVASTCKECAKARTKLYKQNHYQKVKHLAKARGRQYKLKHAYGLTPEAYNKMLMEQDFACKICRHPMCGKALAVDHCHKTGKVRGLLCDKCNWGLGHFKDNVYALQTAIEYLFESEEKAG